MSWISEVKTSSKACFKAFENVLFPPKCCVCFELERDAICVDCAAALKPLRIGSCERCGIDDAGDNVTCSWLSSVDVIRPAVDYIGTGGEAVKRLKFNRSLELAEPMAMRMKEAADSLRFDYLAPVPIHWSRRSHRGFNQSELLAKLMAIGPVRSKLLVRTRATWPQSRSTGNVRRTALEGAFEAKPCSGARVLLVDDVITSGGTVEACALALKARGASWVGAVSFAIELPLGFWQRQASGSSIP
ncbi:MAG: ComF family protein [Armatimonadota bacterium]|nr:ComF family protein [Armatimonadota bacterium]